MRRLWLIGGLLAGLPACVGELSAFAALAFSMTLGAWIIGRDRQRQALAEAQHLRLAIASGQHRNLEEHFRKELALAAAGEAVSPERQWVARLQLAGLLVAEWRLDEAREIYGASDDTRLSPQLRALAAFGQHELALLTETPNERRLEAIQRDRASSLQHVPRSFRRNVELAWDALEGLCLVRMGHAREATSFLERGIGAMEYNPALVIYLFHLAQAYEHIGERALAKTRYEEAMSAFPGTRLASEAKARLHALAPSHAEGFRTMLPEAPSGSNGGLALPSASDGDNLALGPGQRPAKPGSDDESSA